MRFGQILFRQFAQPFLAIDAHEDGGHQCDECLIGADVRRRLLTADVLFPRGEREAKRTVAARIFRLPNKPARNLADELFLRGNDARERASVTRRDRERLQFAGDDIGIARWLQQSKGNRFSEHHDEQRAMLMRQRRRSFDVFHNAEKVRRLHDHRSHLVVQGATQLCFEVCQIQRARFGIVSEFRDRHPLMLGVRSQHFAIFGMDGSGS